MNSFFSRMNITGRDLSLPGNQRYQPVQLKPYFGYDNLYIGLGMVEISVLQVLGEIKVIPDDDFALLTDEAIEKILHITTTEVDTLERSVTKHDVRAWVRIAQEILPEPLRRWLHIMLTSYDPLDTGRRLHFINAARSALQPQLYRLIRILASIVRKYAHTLQIGRTHGQHALPLTVGFWLATILYRLVYNTQELKRNTDLLVGKISGAVGAYNAQVGLGIDQRCGSKSFEERVLEKLGLRPSPISTQILPPEPLANFLHTCLLITATIAQLGRDCRHLMRSEISEIIEVFEEGQIASSTMAQKVNPISFENCEGMFIKNSSEYGKVVGTLISEHQRDLTGSSVQRDFPIIVINVMQQLNTFLRGKEGSTFLERITVNEEACLRNFNTSAKLVMAEPLYIALQMAGYEGDAHELVTRKIVPRCKKKAQNLIDIANEFAKQDDGLAKAIDRIPVETLALLGKPEQYTGKAAEKALQIADLADACIQEK